MLQTSIEYAFYFSLCTYAWLIDLKPEHYEYTNRQITAPCPLLWFCHEILTRIKLHIYYDWQLQFTLPRTDNYQLHSSIGYFGFWNKNMGKENIGLSPFNLHLCSTYVYLPPQMTYFFPWLRHGTLFSNIEHIHSYYFCRLLKLYRE